jgi:hypothetical protein
MPTEMPWLLFKCRACGVLFSAQTPRSAGYDVLMEHFDCNIHLTSEPNCHGVGDCIGVEATEESPRYWKRRCPAP